MAGLTADARRLLQIQCGLLLVAAVVAYFAFGGFGASQAAAFGAGAAMLNSWMFARRVIAATEVARTHPGRETAVLLIGAVQRFVLIIGIFALGMGGLKLAPVPMLIGFVAAYSGVLLVKPGVHKLPPGDKARNRVEQSGSS